MRGPVWAFLTAGLLSLSGCEDVPFAPKWNVDVFFPLRYPDVPLQDFAPGNLISPVNVPFTTAVDSETVSSSTREILDQDIDTLRADLIFANQTDLAGTLDVSVAASPVNLFSADPALAVTANFSLRVTAGDTSRRVLNVGLFKNASTLYFQSRGTLRSNTGAVLVVGPGDVLSVGVDLTANIRLSQ